MTAQTSPVQLLRRFCEDWLNRADARVCDEIMSPDYRVDIGGIVLNGLEQYVPATLGQLEEFPGLEITVHELFSNGAQAALRFTEHGRSRRSNGNPAAWRGIALFWSDGAQLVRNVTEEDYLTRRQQLLEGSAAVVEAAAPDPWATQDESADAALEANVREQLTQGRLRADTARIVANDGGDDAILKVDRTRVKELFSAGGSVAFSIVEQGTYLGGLDLSDSVKGRAAELSSVGMVRLDDSGAMIGHIIEDRAGLRRALRV